MSACIRQTATSRPKFDFTLTFIFWSPICPNNFGVVFLWKYILVFEKWFFSFDRSNMQIFTVNITRVVWPHVTNVLDLRYFCEHNPLFYHLNLIPCRYWSWQRNIYFLVNIFVRHTFPMSKSSIKTKTVLTMTDMTQSTELQAFKRPKDGYKVTVKISLCICVVLSWDKLKVRQNLLANDYEIYLVCLSISEEIEDARITTEKTKISRLKQRSENWPKLAWSNWTLRCKTVKTREHYWKYLLLNQLLWINYYESTSGIPRDPGFFLFARHLEKTFQELLHSVN